MNIKLNNRKKVLLVNSIIIILILIISLFGIKVLASSAASIDNIKNGGSSSLNKYAYIGYGDGDAGNLGNDRKDLYCIEKGKYMGDTSWYF